MNKITGRELDPNQFPAWAEFTPSSESLTKVSAREGFQIDLGNPLTLEDLSLTSLGVSGLSTLHDIDVKDSSETVILQRNGSTLETLINQSGTLTMARIGAGIIESNYVSGRGWYVKYGDGTMEQWGSFEGGFNTLTILNANIGTYGWSFYSSAYTNQPYRDLPTPFYDTDYSIVAQQGSSYTFPVATRYDVGKFRMTIVSYVADVGAVRIHWHAKGRWQA